ncbi:MAG TPA: hypothetical protein VFX70_21980 [Mycobacteriales bacterium]|nr:hypothetical protein [Mycobacteriales bacterium]
MSESYKQAMTRTGFTELPAQARAGGPPLLVLQIGCDACSPSATAANLAGRFTAALLWFASRIRQPVGRSR